MSKEAMKKETKNGSVEAPKMEVTDDKMTEIIENLQQQLMHHQQMSLKLAGALEAMQQLPANLKEGNGDGNEN